MREFLRVLCGKKSLLILIIFFVLNLCFFFYQCDDDRQLTLSNGELDLYLATYPEFLCGVEEQANQLSILPLYQNKESFVSKNLDKTVNDYNQLKGTDLVKGENRGIAAFLSFRITDVFFIVFVLFIVIQLLEEQRTGLHLLVRSTYQGRFPLCLLRILILTVGVAVSCLLFYGSNLFLSMELYGEMGFERPLQSVPEFQYCTMTISVGGFFLLSFLLKILVGLIIALFLYTLLGFLLPMLAFLVFAAGLFIEALLYELLLPTSSFNALKYVNLYSVLQTRDFFTRYLNISFFGHAVSVWSVAVGFLLGMLTLSMILCVVFHGICYIKTGGKLTVWIDRWKEKRKKHFLQLPLFWWEGRKIFFSHKGILIFLLIFYVAFGAARDQNYFSRTDYYERIYYEEFGGEINEELISVMEQRKEKLETWLANALKNIANLQEELWSSFDPDSRRRIEAEIVKAEKKRDELKNQIRGLSAVLLRAHEGYAFSKESGIIIHLIQPNSYRLLFDLDSKTVDQNSLFILLAMIGIFSGVMAYERSSNMRSCLRTLKRGRGVLLGKKIKWIFLTAAIVSVTIHFLQVYAISKQFGLNDLSAPAQSMESLRGLTLKVSMQQFLVLLFVLRVLTTFLIGLVILLVSACCNSNLTALTFCLFFLVVPSVFCSMGLLPEGFLSPTKLIGVVGFMLK